MKFIRINDKDLDKNIYRIYPMHRFLELLDYKKLTLVKPKLWKDPMETIIFDASFNLFAQKGFSDKYKDNYYAQCWTLNYESYALWNEYAPLHNGVRVRTTLRKLIELIKSQKDQSNDTWFLGAVNYRPIRLVKQWINENLPYVESICLPKKPYGHIYSLFIKLNQYEHENEIRLVYNAKNKISKDIDVYDEIFFEPKELFDRILLDPRMHENIYKIYKSKFIEYGFNKDKIIRSGLLNEIQLRKKLKINT